MDDALKPLVKEGPFTLALKLMGFSNFRYLFLYFTFLLTHLLLQEEIFQDDLTKEPWCGSTGRTGAPTISSCEP